MPQAKINFGPKVGAAKKTFPPPKKELAGKPGKVNPFLKNDAAKKPDPPAAAEPAKPDPVKPTPAPAQEVKVAVSANKEVKVSAPAKPAGKAPKFTDELMKSYDADEGKTLVIDCVCEGEPEPDVDWLFNGKIVKDEGRHKYLFESDNVIALEISNVCKDDEGEYKCVCTNKSGKVECSTKVSVKAKPAPAKPKDPTPEPSPESVKKAAPKSEPKVESKAPTSNGSSTTFKKREKKGKLPIERDGIKNENPEKYYEFGDEIGRGKFSVVKYATSKTSGQKYAAKIIKFDSDSVKFAIREYDIMVSGNMNSNGLVQLHEAYLVRKYLILIMDLVDGKTLLDKVASMNSVTEDDVAFFIRRILEILQPIHSKKVVHLDLRPTNIRFINSRDLVILDYNSARTVLNKKHGAVVDVIGDTEFCAPEMLNFDPVQGYSDIWSIGVLTYILLSGISPFYYEDEDQVLLCVQKVKYEFSKPEFDDISSEAKDFIKKIFIRIPENRMTVDDALKHKWLSSEYQPNRKRVVLSHQDVLRETDERLYSEEEEEYIEASLVFRTFDEEEYESPEESDDEDEED